MWLHIHSGETLQEKIDRLNRDDKALQEALAGDYLESNGFTSVPHEKNSHDAISPKEVSLAEQFLSQLEKDYRIVTKNRWSSYGLQYQAKLVLGEYVSIGAVIQAALNLGFRVSPILNDDAFTPNAWIGYYPKSLSVLLGKYQLD